MSAVPAEVVDAKTGVEESLLVFSVAHGVIVWASGLQKRCLPLAERVR